MPETESGISEPVVSNRVEVDTTQKYEGSHGSYSAREIMAAATEYLNKDMPIGKYVVQATLGAGVDTWTLYSFITGLAPISVDQPLLDATYFKRAASFLESVGFLGNTRPQPQAAEVSFG